MVPTVSVDKTDGCQIYLSKDSLGVEVISSKSSEINVLTPKGNGDYVSQLTLEVTLHNLYVTYFQAEFAVPEQFKTTVVPGKGLKTVIVENKGQQRYLLVIIRIPFKQNFTYILYQTKKV